jgi:hypothetical protein
MNTFFTLCSNNYLAQATVLGASVKQHEPDAAFIIVLVDKKTADVDYAAIPFEVLPMGDIEPRTDELAAKYDIVELNTCVKPRVFEYLFTERGAERVIYLDPDIRVYAPFTELDHVFAPGAVNVAVTPHALTPIPFDGKSPTDNHILRFGVYNFGFVALARDEETLRLASWWKERTYTAGYIKPEEGQFVDQIYGNLMPVIFRGVGIVRHEGYNMAPWNLHERTLTREGTAGRFLVNGKPLVFFHFSSFRIDSGELPVHHYNRFAMKDRPDLAPLYAEYNDALKAAGYDRYRPVPWAYAPVTQPRPLDGLRRRGRALGRVGVTWAIKVLPTSVTDRLYQTLRDTRS